MCNFEPPTGNYKSMNFQCLGQSLRFRVWGLGFKVLGDRVLGIRVLRFRVLGFRVLGFRVLGFRDLGFEGPGV